jgi:hypothetical protein
MTAEQGPHAIDDILFRHSIGHVAGDLMKPTPFRTGMENVH